MNNIIVTRKELEYRLSWNLHQKIDHAAGTIEKFLNETKGKAYISFSGGKDSTVLLDIVRRFVDKNIVAVFCNTGNEYPEIVQFVKTFDNVTIIRPKMKFREVIERYGFPLISKEQSKYIHDLKYTKSDITRQKRIYGTRYKKGGFLLGKVSDKWMFLKDAPFDISDTCCTILKKDPFKLYLK